MIDLILRNARLAGATSLTDLGIDDGVITAVDATTAAAQTIDLAGGWSPRRWWSRISTWTPC